jgi:hypothetical protein
MTCPSEQVFTQYGVVAQVVQMHHLQTVVHSPSTQVAHPLTALQLVWLTRSNLSLV